MPHFVLPAIPVSAGALVQDESGRVLILNPTYKDGWTIPGGIMEADGESPWDAARRELREETGLVAHSGRLMAVDTRPAKEDRQFGLRFLFHCGVVDEETAQSVQVDGFEISEYRFAPLPEALELLRKPIRRRVKNSIHAAHTVYLEDGRPLPAVE